MCHAVLKFADQCSCHMASIATLPVMNVLDSVNPRGQHPKQHLGFVYFIQFISSMLKPAVWTSWGMQIEFLVNNAMIHCKVNGTFAWVKGFNVKQTQIKRQIFMFSEWKHLAVTLIQSKNIHECVNSEGFRIRFMNFSRDMAENEHMQTDPVTFWQHNCLTFL